MKSWNSKAGSTLIGKSGNSLPNFKVIKVILGNLGGVIFRNGCILQDASPELLCDDGEFVFNLKDPPLGTVVSTKIGPTTFSSQCIFSSFGNNDTHAPDIGRPGMFLSLHFLCLVYCIGISFFCTIQDSKLIYVFVRMRVRLHHCQSLLLLIMVISKFVFPFSFVGLKICGKFCAFVSSQ